MDPQEAVTFLLTKVRKTFDLLLIFCPIISINGGELPVGAGLEKKTVQSSK